MIIAADLVCWGSQHVLFNAGTLQTILAAFPDDKLAFFGEESHIGLIQRQMGPEAAKISWTPIRIAERQAQYSRRLRSELNILKTLFKVLPPGSDHRVVLLASMPSTLLALKLNRKRLPAGTPIQIVLHGGLSGLGQTRSLHPIRRLKDAKTAITLWGRQNIQYLVLEENIRDLILTRLPFLPGRVEVLEHPSTPGEFAHESISLRYPIRFGFLGLANRQKGFTNFVELAAEAVRKHGRRVEFHALGRSAQNMRAIPGLNALTSQPAAQHLSRDAYMDGLKQLHFAVFPYSLGHYESSPSGTLLDALAWGKPIVATRIPMFQNLFRKYGDLGYLFSTQAELKEIVDTIVSHPDPAAYQARVSNLWKARAERTPAALAPAYRAICERAKNLPENGAMHGSKTGFSFSFHRKEE